MRRGRLRLPAARRGGRGGRLFRARRMRLPRRDMRSRRRFGANRLRQSCRLRRPVETREPGGEIRIAPLKRLQKRFFSCCVGKVLLHDVMVSSAALTAGSDGTASTFKSLMDAIAGNAGGPSNDKAAFVGGLVARELSLSAALHQAPGGWRPAPLHSWPTGRRLFRESPRRRPDPSSPSQISETSPLVPSDIFFPARFGSPSLVYPPLPDATTRRCGIRSEGKV